MATFGINPLVSNQNERGRDLGCRNTFINNKHFFYPHYVNLMASSFVRHILRPIIGSLTLTSSKLKLFNKAIDFTCFLLGLVFKEVNFKTNNLAFTRCFKS